MGTLFIVRELSCTTTTVKTRVLYPVVGVFRYCSQVSEEVCVYLRVFTFYDGPRRLDSLFVGDKISPKQTGSSG